MMHTHSAAKQVAPINVAQIKAQAASKPTNPENEYRQEFAGMEDRLYNFSSLRIHSPAIQPKLSINQPNDVYEQEADAVADKVMRMHSSHSFEESRVDTIQRKCNECEAEEKIQRKENIPNPLSEEKGWGEVIQRKKTATNTFSLGESGGEALSGGKPLSEAEKNFFEPRFGFDFGNVRIYDDYQAHQSAKAINALAYTLGNNIVFNANQYQPQTDAGKKLMAHELTHTIQQNAGGAPQKMIQRTRVGQILDEFFWAFSTERLWIMNENDAYTQLVRAWRPVISALDTVKENIASDCETWNTSHHTDAGWTPGMTDPPVTDPNAYVNWISHPPGTDPDTCAQAFIVYNWTRPVRIETTALSTCAIGSFGLYVTVDAIDCTNHTANINVWMYNAMDQGSFGRFAEYFPMSGMQRQYMWWNWNETINWSATRVSTAP